MAFLFIVYSLNKAVTKLFKMVDFKWIGRHFWLLWLDVT